MSEFYLKKGAPQRVSDEQILEAFKNNNFSSISEAARYIAAKYTVDGKYSYQALAKRLKVLGYKCVAGKLVKIQEVKENE